jgi:hypothetical protein
MAASGPGKWALKEGRMGLQALHRGGEQPGIFTALAGLVSRLSCQAHQN